MTAPLLYAGLGELVSPEGRDDLPVWGLSFRDHGRRWYLERLPTEKYPEDYIWIDDQSKALRFTRAELERIAPDALPTVCVKPLISDIGVATLDPTDERLQRDSVHQAGAVNVVPPGSA